MTKKPSSISRRHLLIGGSLLAFGAYSTHRGLRYPRMGYEPHSINPQRTHSTGVFKLIDAIAIDFESLSFRAIAPEPSMDIDAVKGRFNVRMNNVAPNAVLTVSGQGIHNINEEQDGINRMVRIDAATNQRINLSWALPNEDGFRFAVIGDTGGNTELEWCLTRAHELGAQFLLHLGDFNYGNGDYTRAIDYFHAAPLPCYITIGNHDFNDSGLVYHRFRAELGQLNNSFSVAGTRFVNVDTGADFFPANAGLRGKLMSQLQASPQEQQIFFTHRPLRDPRPGQDHVIGGVNGIKWLLNAMSAAGGGPLLTGHVHHSAELDTHGVQQYTIGEGLGHEDILLQRQVAQLLMGQVERGQKPTFTWVPLQMPWAMHNSHTHTLKLNKRGDQRLIDGYKALRRSDRA